MSARKRHTEMIDFMRMFMANEITGAYTFNRFWNKRRKELIKKLEKRGWVEPRTVTVSQLYAGNWKTNTVYITTKKGRKAIYRLDRYVETDVRLHRFTLSTWGPYNSNHMKHQNDSEIRSIKKVNKVTKGLRAAQIKRHK